MCSLVSLNYVSVSFWEMSMEELQMLQERGEAMRSLLQRAQGPSGWHLKLEEKSGGRHLGDLMPGHIDHRSQFVINLNHLESSWILIVCQLGAACFQEPALKNQSDRRQVMSRPGGGARRGGRWWEQHGTFLYTIYPHPTPILPPFHTITQNIQTESDTVGDRERCEQ